MITKVKLMKPSNLDIVDQKLTKLKTAVKTAVRIRRRKKRENQATKEQQDQPLINKTKAVCVEQ